MTEDQLLKQRIRRRLTNNQATKRYEKTPKGFLMRCYRNMLSRIQGVQKLKFHLYSGKELLTKEEFYSWSIVNEDFLRLYKNYVDSGYERRLAPSADRKDSTKGYIISNMEWVTMSENFRRGTLSQWKQKYGSQQTCMDTTRT